MRDKGPTTYLQFSVQICRFLKLAEETLQDVKLCSAESQQQVPDLAQQVLEGSEELGKVGVVPLDIEGAVREDEEAADDCEAGDGEHKAVTKIIISSVRIPRVIVMVGSYEI